MYPSAWMQIWQLTDGGQNIKSNCSPSVSYEICIHVVGYKKLPISNSLPTNEDICSSVIITWSVCYSACTKVLCFTITNKHGRSTETNVMSSTAFCERILSAPRKKMEKMERKRKKGRDLYDVEVVEVDTTRNS